MDEPITPDSPDVQDEPVESTRWLGLDWPRFAGWQWKVLILLSVLNLLNYFDRMIIFPMFDVLKEEFDVSDFRLGLLGSMFIFAHSLVVLPFGSWADRGSKKKIIALSVAFWSGAAMFSGVVSSFRGLMGARALLGVGEGAFSPAGTAMISDCFPRGFRARAQSIFTLGMLAGGVLGLALGGLLAEQVGWRQAFFLVALPGFMLALPCYRLRVPVPQPADETTAVSDLLKIRAYLFVLLGGMFAVFAVAAFVTWGTVFGIRYHDLSMGQAAAWLGLLVLGGALGGVLSGGFIADRLQARWAWGRALTIGAALLVGTPFLLLAVTTDSQGLFFFGLFMATFFLTCSEGPTTAVIHDLTPQRAHALAFALFLFVIHLFGDTMAPALVGRISDLYSLRLGMLAAVAANFLAALCFFVVGLLIRSRVRKKIGPS
jgi:MFS transporter, Spinster family, sphingosine-1-phosphate transporter